MKKLTSRKAKEVVVLLIPYVFGQNANKVLKYNILSFRSFLKLPVATFDCLDSSARANGKTREI